MAESPWSDVWFVVAAPLDLGLLVDRDLIGEEWNINVVGNEGALGFPTAAEGAGYQAPARAERAPIRDGLIDGEWALGSNGGVVIHATSVSFRVDPEQIEDSFVPEQHRPAGDDARRLVQAVESWLDRWSSWLSVLASQPVDLRNPGDLIPSRPSSHTWPFLVMDGRPSLRGGAHTNITIRPDDSAYAERVITRAVVEYAIARAGAGDLPTTPLLLRRNAHLAARRGDFRSAIADTGTACEAWLTELLGLAPDHGFTLGGLVTRAADRGLPSDSSHGLVRPRNDALHRGVGPAGPVLERALTIGDEIWELTGAPEAAIASGLAKSFRPMRMDMIIDRPAAPVAEPDALPRGEAGKD